MFNKILVANRGEIACRVIKTARKLGIYTVAVYSDADRDALHVAMADEAVHIGASPVRESYLLIDRVIDAAKKTGAEAIHPGYGFLSENAQFSRACADNGLVFIGPPANSIAAMGSKSAAKQIMQEAGVPLVPGYHGADQSTAILKQAADEMGYPVLLKATAGGGGKGMRQVWSAQEFEESLVAAKREALSSFSDDTMLVEKYLTRPRHVEIQVFCDTHGNAVYLAERDCSVQRRHQKVIEEAPAPGMTPELRQQMGEAAIQAAQAIAYEGAGTVEFLLDEDGSFYFMEMNTRLQVEHPVTEMITGQDLVEWQLRVAAGEPLPLSQKDIAIKGHAIEVRIYAEDPENDFLPVTGKLTYLKTPDESAHVRIDTGVLQGDEVSVFYDPMIAKLIVWDSDRERAVQRLTRALSEYRINGMKTNVEFLYNLASCKPFLEADLDTGFIEKHRTEIFHQHKTDIVQGAALSALFLVLRQQKESQSYSRSGVDPYSPWHQKNAWRLNEPHLHTWRLKVFGEEVSVSVEQKASAESVRYILEINGKQMLARGELDNDIIKAEIDGYRLRASVAEHDGEFVLFTLNSAIGFSLVKPDLGCGEERDDEASLFAPMNGTIVELLAEINNTVAKGDPLLVMEAMKMEHTIRAPADGRVVEFYFNAGDLVDGGIELLHFEHDES